MSTRPHSAVARLSGRSAAPIAVGVAMMVVGVLLRLPVFEYAGPHAQAPFNRYIYSEGWASYTDIASLYFRDSLWRHPVPYFDYRLEYPVVTGAFTWVMSHAPGGVRGYFVASAAGLIGCGAALLTLVRRVPTANVWLLALSPALALYSVMNWDLLALALTVGAIVLYLRRRDLWGSALLALATSAKLFPVLLLPFVVLIQLLERRWRQAALSAGVFVGVTLLVNLPVAAQPAGGGFAVRDGWAYFFDFNKNRRPELNLWYFVDRHLSTADVNVISGLLLAGLVAVLLWLTARSFRATASRLVILPSFAAALAGGFFVNKVYSTQYSLWIVVMLALLAAPVALVAAFAIVDLVSFYASLHVFSIPINHQPAHHNFVADVLRPADGVRELAVLATLLWFSAQLIRSPVPRAPGRARWRLGERV